ncbi:aldose 1-epimerase [Hirschia litorea]|uniref:Aldose 1-epimerase n=1 Tax=Hirschia litorea TaxID=1199156 RepID=A0ABW2IIR5_9PROT
MTIILQNEALTLGVEPKHGGQVSLFKMGGFDVFRPQKATDALSALDSGSFVLLPFSNRIKQGFFEFDGKRYQLPINWQGDENAIHGNGWYSAWEVEKQTETSCELRYEHDGSWWPWPFVARLTYSLEGRSLKMAAEVRNIAEECMPVGIGFHPYFLANADTTMQFNARSAYLPFESHSALALGQAVESRLNFSRTKPVKSSELIDHNYDGWDGIAHLKNCGAKFDVLIKADENMRHAMVYSPPSEGFVCFEPTTHSAGAFNLENGCDHGVRRLDPAQVFTAGFSIELTDRK